MHSARLPLYAPTPSIKTTNPSPRLSSFHTTSARKSHDNSLVCKASNSSSSYPITDFDLYDLLGVDSSSDQSQIKVAYRGLQKRCHPDIAGPPGHDMAIILNEAYALLSDPTLRLAYDKEQAKIEELRGYTSKPMYSVWCGSENEQRAVFVDEVKCVGCLKCALFAEKTFAVESIYGRARVVAQWADTEDKIEEAIEACPVDCISIVERSNLAALEFLMSKQPRGNVRIGAGNTVGTRVSNIFVDVEKFQARFKEANDKVSKNHSKESDIQREARISAIQAVRSISNWLYWKSPNAGGSMSHIHQKLIPITRRSTEPNINKLRGAAAARKQARETGKPIRKVSLNYIYKDEYWTPSTLVLPEATKNSPTSRAASEQSPSTELKKLHNNNFVDQKKSRSNLFVQGVPLGAAIVAAVIVRLQVGEGVAGGLEEHLGGSLVLDIVNSSWLQVSLAGVTWYLIGMAIIELLESLKIKLGMYKK
ncbi:unnamed protein product [Ilex paraguariensis]|uniref:J domain-containing protein n=1 Tax=Ilex paraguariensis TaxID=185542 RepID=A0ABC8RUW6_9AQUA